ncbi:MAG: hypothetical protein HYU66_01740 [Armatimonadetes bacterium]|nr:hypothetical protein [Armatimonadota bacterium]
MTGRDRLRAILRRQPREGLSWTTLVDGATLSGVPEALRGNGGIDFYRHLGCDIFLLNGWGTPHAFRSPSLRWADGVEASARADGDRLIQEWHSPAGSLTAVSRRGHPVKYPVTDLAEMRTYRELWEGATYEPYADSAALAATEELIGDVGIVSRFWGPSTLPRLLENDMGTEGFYTLHSDHTDDMEALLAVMHERELVAFDHLAASPCESVTLCENTSTAYISPTFYRKYNLPHQADFVDKVKAAGKTALLHMCGHVRDILPDIRETGCDGIHALTPPPVGNTPWEQALDVLGEELIIVGCLDPATFVSGPVENIGPALDRLYTPRLREANVVLWAAADGIAVELARFEAVQHWFEAQVPPR